MCAGKLVPAVTQTMCPPHGRSRVFSCLWHHPVLVLGLGRLVLPAPGGLSSLAVVPRPDRAVAWCSMQVPVQVPEMQQALSANLRLAGAQTTVTVMVTTRAGWNTRSGCIHGWRWVRACVRACVGVCKLVRAVQLQRSAVPCSCHFRHGSQRAGQPRQEGGPLRWDRSIMKSLRRNCIFAAAHAPRAHRVSK